MMRCTLLTETEKVMDLKNVQSDLFTNYTNPTSNSTQTHHDLNGFPAFCSESAYSRCFNTTLATCDQCSYAGFVMFAFIVALLGLAIVTINLFVVRQVVRKTNKGTYDKIKSSLAVADILTGFQALIVSLYNLHWTMKSTSAELIEKKLAFQNSPQAYIGGIFYLLGFSSSLYHLVFLSEQRVFAMRWPLKYRMQKARTVYIGLGIVWFLSILSAVAPAWFPNDFEYIYSLISFNFTYALYHTETPNFALFVGIITINYILPIIITTCFMIYSAILIRSNAAKSRRLSGRNSDQEAHNKRESSMLKTVALMQVGFTLTLVPLWMFLLWDLIEPFSCEDYSITQLVGTYLALSNGLVNPLVYIIRDKEFRNSFVELFQSKKPQ